MLTSITLMTPHEATRRVLVVAFACVFMVTVGAAFAVAVWGSDAGRAATKDLLQLLIPVETAFLGAATTYYFTGGVRR